MKVYNMKKYLSDLEKYSNEIKRNSGKYRIDWTGAAKKCPVPTNRELMENINTNVRLSRVNIIRLILLGCDYRLAKKYFNCMKKNFKEPAIELAKAKYMNELTLFLSFDDKLDYVINKLSDNDIIKVIAPEITIGVNTTDDTSEISINNNIDYDNEITGLVNIIPDNAIEDKVELISEETEIIDKKEDINTSDSIGDVEDIDCVEKGNMEDVNIMQKSRMVTLNEIKELILIKDTYIDPRKVVILSSIIDKVIERKLDITVFKEA